MTNHIPSFYTLTTRAGQWSYLKAHLADAMLELRLAHPAYRARCQERVDQILDKMSELRVAA